VTSTFRVPKTLSARSTVSRAARLQRPRELPGLRVVVPEAALESAA
jgi:hypothetical protein